MSGKAIGDAFLGEIFMQSRNNLGGSGVGNFTSGQPLHISIFNIKKKKNRF
jgi:hypothetical protein